MFDTGLPLVATIVFILLFITERARPGDFLDLRFGAGGLLPLRGINNDRFRIMKLTQQETTFGGKPLQNLNDFRKMRYWSHSEKEQMSDVTTKQLLEKYGGSMLGFGKYSGSLVSEVEAEDSSYLTWLAKHRLRETPQGLRIDNSMQLDPHRNLPNWREAELAKSTKLAFGKYKGETVKDVEINDSAYLDWVESKDAYISKVGVVLPRIDE